MDDNVFIHCDNHSRGLKNSAGASRRPLSSKDRARSYGDLSMSVAVVENAGRTTLYNSISLPAIEESHNVGCQFVDGILARFTGHSENVRARYL
jgi:hypothetical protein